jgi:hypothetical protein
MLPLADFGRWARCENLINLQISVGVELDARVVLEDIGADRVLPLVNFFSDSA